MSHRNAAYWICTGLFCAVLGFSGVTHLARVEFMVENMANLGYPPYVLTILGAGKVLGVVALLSPGRPLLKEWAYAGFAFDLVGAAASHAFSGDPLNEIIAPLVVGSIGAASYALRPAARRLASSPVLGNITEPAAQPSHG